MEDLSQPLEVVDLNQQLEELIKRKDNAKLKQFLKEHSDRVIIDKWVYERAVQYDNYPAIECLSGDKTNIIGRLFRQGYLDKMLLKYIVGSGGSGGRGGRGSGASEKMKQSAIALFVKKKRIDFLTVLLDNYVFDNRAIVNFLSLSHHRMAFSRQQWSEIVRTERAKMNGRNPEGKTPLTLACEQGNQAIVELLVVRYGADVNQGDGCANTPLIISCCNEDEKLLHFLVEHGADVNAGDDHGNTPLTIACRHLQRAMVEYLLEHGADVHTATSVGDTPLTVACDKGDEGLVKLLVEHGADVNQYGKEEATVYSVYSPLMTACQYDYEGHEAVVRYLLEHGANVHEQDGRHGETALELACRTGNATILRCLLEHGADPNMENWEGQTPFMVLLASFKKGSEERLKDLMQYLVSHGANLQHETREGDTPLIYACRTKKEGQVQCLLELGVDVNQRNQYGDTALTVALRSTHPAIIKYLMEHGATP